MISTQILAFQCDCHGSYILPYILCAYSDISMEAKIFLKENVPSANVCANAIADVKTRNDELK